MFSGIASDYSVIDLPVFCASARDYVRIRKQVQGDGMSLSINHLNQSLGLIMTYLGEPTCFTNVNDTGIPSLQQWCRDLTVSSRERAARTFLKSIKTFAKSIQQYVEAGKEVTQQDRELLREKWETSLVDAVDEEDLDDEDGDEDEDGYPYGYKAPKPQVLKTDANGNITGMYFLSSLLIWF